MLNIIIVPCLNDNYSYVCYDEKSDAFVVDPSEFKPVHDCLENNNLNLKFVLNTQIQNKYLYTHINKYYYIY